MDVFIRYCGDTYCVQCDENESVATLQEKLCSAHAIPEGFVLCLDGEKLAPRVQISSTSAEEGTTFDAIRAGRRLIRGSSQVQHSMAATVVNTENNDNDVALLESFDADSAIDCCYRGVKRMEDGRSHNLCLMRLTIQKTYALRCFSRAHLMVIIVFDVRSRSSFEDVDYMMGAARYRSEETLKVIIAATHCEDPARCVSREEAELFARNNQATYVETEDGDGNELFMQVLYNVGHFLKKKLFFFRSSKLVQP